MANELKVTIVGDASSAYEAMQKVNQAIGQSAERADVFTKALEKAESEGQQFSEAVRTAAASLETYVSSTEAATAATEAFTGRQQAMVSGTIAANGALKTFEGSMMGATRAAGSFLSTTLGLGPALEAAFPVIGAAAFGMVVADIGKELVHVYDEYVSLGAAADKLLDTVHHMQERDFINVESIETATMRLDEANASATALADTAKKLHDSGFKELFGDLLSGNTGGLGADLGLIRGARQAAEDSANSTLKSIALEERRLELQHRANEAHIEAIHAGDAALEGQQKITAELEKQLALHAEEQRYTALRERLMGNPAAANAGEQMRRDQDAASRGEAAAKRAGLAGANERVDFEIQKLSAETLDKDLKAIDESIKKDKKAYGEMVMQMVRDNEFAAKEQERIDEEVNAEGVRLMNERIKMEEDAKRKQEALDDKIRRDQEREQLRLQQVYRQTFDAIDEQLNQSVDAWLRGGQRMSYVWTNMADQMAISTINALLKIAAQEAIGAALHKAIGDSQRLDDAKTAAAGAYAATSGIPIIGPILAPIAAGTAFAAVAAFDTGTDYVPKTGLAVLHQGEAVLDRDQNRQITRALTGGAVDGKPGAIHFHDNATYNAIDGTSVSGMVRTHGAEFRREMMRQLRLSNRI